MSKATIPFGNTTEIESIVGFQYPLFYVETAPLLCGKVYTSGQEMRDLVMITVNVADWTGHPLFPGMCRLYRVQFFSSSAWSDYKLVEDDGPHLKRSGELTWSEVLSLVRRYFAWFNPSSIASGKPLVSILNGGYSERICREIYAVCPHHDLQGRGDGK